MPLNSKFLEISNDARYSSRLKSTIAQMSPIFMGSWSLRSSTKWRGVASELNYNSYLRNAWLVIDTGIKGKAGMPIIEFSAWDAATSTDPVSLPNVISYKASWRNSAMQSSSLRRTSVDAAGVWFRRLPSFSSVLNHTPATHSFFNFSRASSSLSVSVLYARWQHLCKSDYNSFAALFYSTSVYYGGTILPWALLSSHSVRKNLQYKSVILGRRFAFLRFWVYDHLNFNRHYHSHNGLSASTSFNLSFLTALRERTYSISRLPRAIDTLSLPQTLPVCTPLTQSFPSLLFHLNFVLSAFFECKVKGVGRTFFLASLKVFIVNIVRLYFAYYSAHKGSSHLFILARLGSLDRVSDYLFLKLTSFSELTRLSVRNYCSVLSTYLFLVWPAKLAFFTTNCFRPAASQILLSSVSQPYKLKNYYAASLFAARSGNLSLAGSSSLSLNEFVGSYAKLRKHTSTSRLETVSHYRPSFKRPTWKSRRGFKSRVRSGTKIFRFRKRLFSRFKLPLLRSQFTFLQFWSFNFFSFFSFKRQGAGFFWLSLRLVQFFKSFLRFLKFYNLNFLYLRSFLSTSTSRLSQSSLPLNLKLYTWALTRRFWYLLRAFRSLSSKFFARHWNSFNSSFLAVDRTKIFSRYSSLLLPSSLGQNQFSPMLATKLKVFDKFELFKKLKLIKYFKFGRRSRLGRVRRIVKRLPWGHFYGRLSKYERLIKRRQRTERYSSASMSARRGFSKRWTPRHSREQKYRKSSVSNRYNSSFPWPNKRHLLNKTKSLFIKRYRLSAKQSIPLTGLRRSKFSVTRSPESFLTSQPFAGSTRLPSLAFKLLASFWNLSPSQSALRFSRLRSYLVFLLTLRTSVARAVQHRLLSLITAFSRSVASVLPAIYSDVSPPVNKRNWNAFGVRTVRCTLFRPCPRVSLLSALANSASYSLLSDFLRRTLLFVDSTSFDFARGPAALRSSLRALLQRRLSSLLPYKKFTVALYSYLDLLSAYLYNRPAVASSLSSLALRARFLTFRSFLRRSMSLLLAARSSFRLHCLKRRVGRRLALTVFRRRRKLTPRSVSKACSLRSRIRRLRSLPVIGGWTGKRRLFRSGGTPFFSSRVPSDSPRLRRRPFPFVFHTFRNTKVFVSHLRLRRILFGLKALLISKHKLRSFARHAYLPLLTFAGSGSFVLNALSTHALALHSTAVLAPAPFLVTPPTLPSVARGLPFLLHSRLALTGRGMSSCADRTSSTPVPNLPALVFAATRWSYLSANFSSLADIRSAFCSTFALSFTSAMLFSSRSRPLFPVPLYRLLELASPSIDFSVPILARLSALDAALFSSSPPRNTAIFSSVLLRPHLFLSYRSIIFSAVKSEVSSLLYASPRTFLPPFHTPALPAQAGYLALQSFVSYYDVLRLASSLSHASLSALRTLNSNASICSLLLLHRIPAATLFPFYPLANMRITLTSFYYHSFKTSFTNTVGLLALVSILRLITSFLTVRAHQRVGLPFRLASNLARHLLVSTSSVSSFGSLLRTRLLLLRRFFRTPRVITPPSCQKTHAFLSASPFVGCTAGFLNTDLILGVRRLSTAFFTHRRAIARSRPLWELFNPTTSLTGLNTLYLHRRIAFQPLNIQALSILYRTRLKNCSRYLRRKAWLRRYISRVFPARLSHFPIPSSRGGIADSASTILMFPPARGSLKLYRPLRQPSLLSRIGYFGALPSLSSRRITIPQEKKGFLCSAFSQRFSVLSRRGYSLTNNQVSFRRFVVLAARFSSRLPYIAGGSRNSRLGGVFWFSNRKLLRILAGFKRPAPAAVPSNFYCLRVIAFRYCSFLFGRFAVNSHSALPGSRFYKTQRLTRTLFTTLRAVKRLKLMAHAYRRGMMPRTNRRANKLYRKLLRRNYSPKHGSTVTSNSASNRALLKLRTVPKTAPVNKVLQRKFAALRRKRQFRFVKIHYMYSLIRAKRRLAKSILRSFNIYFQHHVFRALKWFFSRMKGRRRRIRNATRRLFFTASCRAVLLLQNLKDSPLSSFPFLTKIARVAPAVLGHSGNKFAAHVLRRFITRAYSKLSNFKLRTRLHFFRSSKISFLFFFVSFFFKKSSLFLASLWSLTSASYALPSLEASFMLKWATSVNRLLSPPPSSLPVLPLVAVVHRSFNFSTLNCAISSISVTSSLPLSLTDLLFASPQLRTGCFSSFSTVKYTSLVSFMGFFSTFDPFFILKGFSLSSVSKWSFVLNRFFLDFSAPPASPGFFRYKFYSRAELRRLRAHRSSLELTRSLEHGTRKLIRVPANLRIKNITKFRSLGKALYYKLVLLALNSKKLNAAENSLPFQLRGPLHSTRSVRSKTYRSADLPFTSARSSPAALHDSWIESPNRRKRTPRLRKTEVAFSSSFLEPAIKFFAPRSLSANFPLLPLRLSFRPSFHGNKRRSAGRLSRPPHVSVRRPRSFRHR